MKQKILEEKMENKKMEMSYNLNDADINLEELEKALLDLKKEHEDAINKANEVLNNPSNWPRFFKPKELGTLNVEDCYMCYDLNGEIKPWLKEDTIRLDSFIKIIKEFKEADLEYKKITLNEQCLYFIYCDLETGDEKRQFIGYHNGDIAHNSNINKLNLTLTLKKADIPYLEEALKHPFIKLRHPYTKLQFPKIIAMTVFEIPKLATLIEIFAKVRVPMSVEIPNFKEKN